MRKAYGIPAGHEEIPISNVVVAGQLAFVSGQIGLTEDGTAPEDIETQTRRALELSFRALELVDATPDDVVKCTIFLTEGSDFPRMNAVYRELFRAPYPARATVIVKALGFGASVEIDVIAELNSAMT